MKNVKFQGPKHIHTFPLNAFEGEKGMKKTDFAKKYKGRFHTDSAWEAIQAALKANKEAAKAEAEAKK